MDEKELFRIIEDKKIKFINFQFTDLNGIIKAVTSPISKLPEAIENNVWFDGSSIEGFSRIFESDMYLKPDLNTFAVIPWTENTDNPTARIISNVYNSEGELFESSPRNILIRQIEKASQMGYEFMVGPELEFFLLKKENGRVIPLPHDEGGYFDQSTDLADEIKKEMTTALQAFNIDVEALHHEVAAGQHEIDFHYNDALTIADYTVTFKYAIKTIAHKYDLHATFMPKPFEEIDGSGMHVHQSLFQNGENLFYDKTAQYKLSKLARHFIAGQLNHIKAMTAITNPTVNSFKRLVVGYEAPVYITWGQINRSALIRIPKYSPGREKSVRCELRCPDPTSNPYLAFAIMLAAGLDGIKKELKLGPPFEENTFELTEADLKLKSIDTLPNSLNKAIDYLENDPVIADALGKETFKKYVAAKRKEWQSYHKYVSNWEYQRYLEIY